MHCRPPAPQATRACCTAPHLLGLDTFDQRCLPTSKRYRSLKTRTWAWSQWVHPHTRAHALLPRLASWCPGALTQATRIGALFLRLASWCLGASIRSLNAGHSDRCQGGWAKGWRVLCAPAWVQAQVGLILGLGPHKGCDGRAAAAARRYALQGSAQQAGRASSIHKPT